MPKRFSHHEFKVQTFAEANEPIEGPEDEYGFVVTHTESGIRTRAAQWKDRTKNRQLAVIRMLYEIVDYERMKREEVERALRTSRMEDA